MKNSSVAMCVLMMAVLSGCVDINTTMTLKNSLPTSIELKVESPFIKVPKKSSIARETLGSDGYVDKLDTGDGDKKTLHYFFMKIPFEALGSEQHFNSFFEENNREHKGAEIFIPSISNKTMVFDMAVLNNAIAEKQPSHKKNDKRSKIPANLSWSYQFISEDETRVKELIYLDRQGQWITCEVKKLNDNRTAYLIPLKELLVGNIQQIVAVLL